MRGSFVVAGALVGAFACARFGADTPDTDQPVADAGSKPKDSADSAPPAVSSDAGVAADADAGSILPPDAFGNLEFDKNNEFDSFERDNLLGGGPLDWDPQTNGNPDGDVYGWETCSEPSCSGSTVAWCANDNGGGGFLVTNLQSATRIVRLNLTMALRRTNHSAEGQAQLISIQLENDRFIFLEVNGTELRLGDQYKESGDVDYRTEFTPAGAVPDDQWSKYRLYIDLNLGVVALQKDGALSGSVRMLRSQVITKLQTARVGITFGKNDSFKMRFDDVGLKQRGE